MINAEPKTGPHHALAMAQLGRIRLPIPRLYEDVANPPVIRAATQTRDAIRKCLRHDRRRTRRIAPDCGSVKSMSKIESIIMLLVAAHLSAEIVHELGHLLAARYFGVRVLRISVGLGPEIVGMSDRLGTRWSLGWIPLGSYISFVDEKCPTSGTIAIWRGVINRNSESISSRSCIQRAAIYGAGSAANMLLTPITYALCQLYFVSTLACPGVMELDFDHCINPWFIQFRRWTV